MAADSPLGVELRELEITARRLQALRDAEALDRATCEQVYRAIEARQQALLAEHGQALPTAVRVPEPVPAVVEAIEAATPNSPAPPGSLWWKPLSVMKRNYFLVVLPSMVNMVKKISVLAFRSSLEKMVGKRSLILI